MTLYDQIGVHYARFRQPDARVTRALLDLLAPPSRARLADVGCGTGKYALALARRGCTVLAIDPSRQMLAQAPSHPRVEYLLGSAEALPLAGGSVDAVICVSAIHHFAGLDRALREMDRVCAGGRIVILTADVRLAEPYWFHDYFPEVNARNRERFPPLEELLGRVRGVCRRPVHVAALRIPRDFADLFCGAAWSRPELYLDPELRSCTSSFRLVDAACLDAALRRLAQDLDAGRFHERYREQLARTELDLGIRILAVAPATPAAGKGRA